MIYTAGSLKPKKFSKIIHSEQIRETKLIAEPSGQRGSWEAQPQAPLKNLDEQLKDIPGLKNAQREESSRLEKSYYSRYKTDFKEVEQLGKWGRE